MSQGFTGASATGGSGVFLSLDQTSPEIIVNGKPTFSEGLGMYDGSAIYLNTISDANWLIGLNIATYNKSLATENTVDIQHGSASDEGFTVGVVGGDSSLEINNAHEVYIRGNVGVGIVNPTEAIDVSGNVQLSGALKILEGGTSPTYHTIFQGGDQGADITYTLPTALPGSDKILQSDSGGVLSWIDEPAASVSIGSLITDGTPGSALFIDGDGNLAQDNANFFWDFTNQRLGIGTTTPSSTLTIAGSVALKQNVISTDTILDVTYHTVLVDTVAASGTVTVNLPTASSFPGGEYIIKDYKGNCSVNNIIVDAYPASGDTLDFGSAVTMMNNNMALKFISDGISNWSIFYIDSVGGSTSPGGSDTNVQYNNSSAFGGDDGMTYDDGTKTFNLSGSVPSAEIGSATIGLSPFSIAVQGRYAYVVNNGDLNLQILDISDPSAPIVLSTIATTGAGARGLAVRGRYAYVLNASSGTIQTFDVGNQKSPASLGTVALSGNPYSLVLEGRYAYVANGGSSLMQILDLSDPTTPIITGSISTGVIPNSVAVQGRYAYTVDSSPNLFVFDITDPSSPTNTTSINTGVQGNKIIVQGRYAYIACSDSLKIYDISDLTSLSLASSTVTAGGSNVSLAVQGRRAYIVSNDGTHFLETLDVSDPSAPISLGTTTLHNNGQAICVQGRYAYVINIDSNLQIFDIGGEFAQSFEFGSAEGSSLTIRQEFKGLNGEFWGTLSVGESFGVGGQASVGGQFALGAYKNSGDGFDYLGTDSNGIVYGGSFSTLPFWSLIGNSGTDPSVNFIGTSDGTDFVIRTNDIEAVRIASDGQVGIGTDNPLTKLDILQASGGNDGVGFRQLILRTDTPDASQIFLGCAADIEGYMGFMSYYYGDLQYKSVYVFGGGIKTRSTGMSLFFDIDLTPGTPYDPTTRIFIDVDGSIGIGNSSPAELLDVSGNIIVSGNVYPSADNTYDLGTDANRWRDLYVDGSSVHIGSSGNEATISYNIGSSYLDFFGGKMIVNSSGNVGIGLTNPSRRLSIDAAGNVYMSFNESGTEISAIGCEPGVRPWLVFDPNLPAYTIFSDMSGNIGITNGLGIGTTTITYPLTVFNSVGGSSGWGNVQSAIISDGTEAGLLFSNTSAGGRNYTIISTGNASGIGGGKLSIGDATASSGRITIDNSGHVGIGTNDPVNTLDVLGSQVIGEDYAGTETAPENGLLVQGHVGIGNASPITQLHVAGEFDATYVGQVTTGSSPRYVTVQGRYAYVLNDDATLEVIDVNAVESPVSLGSVACGATPSGICVKGKYAYVIDTTNNTIEVFDITNPANPTSITTVSTNTGPRSIAIQGRYLYIGCYTALTLQVFDIFDPSNPVSIGAVSTITNDGNYAICVQGHYVYILGFGATGDLQIYNVSDPTNPTFVASTTSPVIAYPNALTVEGKYAYVGSNNDTNSFQIWDVSDPTDPTQVGVLTGIYPTTISIQGRYAYVAEGGTSDVNAIDISDPTSPFSTGTVAVGGNAYSAYIQGRYVYTMSNGGNYLRIFDLGGAYLQQLEVGGLEASTLSLKQGMQSLYGEFTHALHVGDYLSVDGDGSIGGKFSILGALDIGGSVLLTDYGNFSAGFDYLFTDGDGLLTGGMFSGVDLGVFSNSAGYELNANLDSDVGGLGYIKAAGVSANETDPIYSANIYATGMDQDVDSASSVTFGDITDSGLTGSRAVVTDGSSKLASSSTTDTEIGYVAGVTSAIQSQLDSKIGVVASGSQLAQSGASTVCTETSPPAGSYEIGGYIDISAISAGTVSLVVDYNDDAGVSKTVTIPLVQLAGTIVATSTAVADLSALVTSIQTDGSANIVVRVTFVGVSVTYSAYAWIKRVV